MNGVSNTQNKEGWRMKILIAGAGGALGKALVTQYLDKGDTVTALVLDQAEMAGIEHQNLTVVNGNVTQPDSLHGICDQQEHVISCIGITRLKGNMTHETVDYQGNLNLLREAERATIGKFGFISPAGTDSGHSKAPLLHAKFRFEEALRKSKLDWVIFRSGGFFSDLADMMKLAEKGPLFVIGNGESRSTPIHVEELATLMIEGMQTQTNTVVEVGGPENLSWLQVCNTCFEIQGKKPRIMRAPVWLCRTLLAVLRPFSFRNYAMGQLLVFMSTHDVCTPTRGKIKLREFLRDLRPKTQ
jgi:uncharacterized protein YbjT (DUF2867 family)